MPLVFNGVTAFLQSAVLSELGTSTSYNSTFSIALVLDSKNIKYYFIFVYGMDQFGKKWGNFTKLHIP